MYEWFANEPLKKGHSLDANRRVHQFGEYQIGLV